MTGQAMAEDQDEKARKRKQQMRSIAIALALAGFALLFYLATIVRLGGNVANRAL